MRVVYFVHFIYSFTYSPCGLYGFICWLFLSSHCFNILCMLWIYQALVTLLLSLFMVFSMCVLSVYFVLYIYFTRFLHCFFVSVPFLHCFICFIWLLFSFFFVYCSRTLISQLFVIDQSLPAGLVFFVYVFTMCMVLFHHFWPLAPLKSINQPTFNLFSSQKWNILFSYKSTYSYFVELPPKHKKRPFALYSWR